MAFRRLRLLALLAALAVAGCGVRADNDAAPATAQIIVKFKGEVPAADPGFLSALGRESGAGFEHLRPLSSGAHVYRVTGLRSDADLDRLIAALGRRADVEYAEPDRRMTIQTPR